MKIKNIFCLFLILLLFLSIGVAAAQNNQNEIELIFHIDDFRYTINGNEYEMDACPLIRENRTFLPIRFVVDPTGAFLLWEGYERKVTIGLKNQTIELWIENPMARINGTETQIDNNPKVTPFILNGRTMLPLRFIAENLGAQVDWDAQKKEIRVIWSIDEAAD